MNVGARMGIEMAMQDGLNAVRQLDAMVPNALRDDAVTLAMWERARRVEQARGGRAKAEPAAPEAPPAAA